MMPTKFMISIEKGRAGLWYAASPEIKGLFVAERTAADAIRKIPEALAELEAARNMAA